MVSLLGVVFLFLAFFAVVNRIGERRHWQGGERLGQRDREELDALRDGVADLAARLHRLEEERDFYVELLEGRDDIPRLPGRGGSPPVGGPLFEEPRPGGEAPQKGPGPPREDPPPRGT